ncbi:hypothetical protein DE146DRAFT_677947 [Phaeosphaeria sp. MPI-PUGE-AT-0046c]|nr:hypothetical protein DE146DRAFT_677947 [Phaeosphaeria sp. MPI-PUGE-AT-0046c]
MLRRLHSKAVKMDEGKLERKTSKRQKIVQFFKSRRRKSGSHEEAPEKIPIASKTISAPTAAQVERPTEATNEPAISDPAQSPPVVDAEQTPIPGTTPASELVATEKVETLSQGQLDTLFSGAPDFSVTEGTSRPTPSVAYPRGRPDSIKETTDSLRLDQPAFTAATLHTTSKTSRAESDERKQYIGYEVDVVELPNMLSAQGIEPGSIGFAHFLELPRSDSLRTDMEGSQSSRDFLQGTKNKELMQSSPERIGIRAVDMILVYDRLIELQDLYETLHDSPGPMSLLNHQSAGELYANLFSKFLTPPGFDGNTDDPTGLRIQILTLMRILKLKGVWYDFSLVEWRIRLGQIVWSDPEPVPEHEPHPLWTEREVLLLQITLACELLLRLDAVSNPEADGPDKDAQISAQEIRELFGTKTRKLDWDLVLARRFLDNILIIKSSDHDGETSKTGGLLSMLGVGAEAEAPKADIVLLPQHQARQLSGLVKFASTIQWPTTETIMQDVAQKLGARDVAQEVEQFSSPEAMFLEPVTPASISVYGTPLQTPRPTSKQLDSYFGHIGKPVLSRDNSHSLRIPLSPTLSPQPDQPRSALAGVGGWLSRSYLTGLVLPGEPISHFLISTLLENDAAAIASLGDSANLYGGFTYATKAWWSKNSIVGRVFACTDGAVECMGWISFPKVPESLHDMWHSIHSEQLPFDDRLSDTGRSALVTQASAIVPIGAFESLKSEDLVLPRDLDPVPVPCLEMQHWELTPLNADLIDSDIMSGPATESDVHIPSITFTNKDDASTQTLTLAFDVQFVTSWPCHSPLIAPAPSMPHILKRSLTGTISRTSSKRSGSVRMTRRNSHGFEPLLSHPPDSTDIAPKPMYSMDNEDGSDTTITRRKPMQAHPLHKHYKYKIVPVAEVLHSDFVVPFDIHAHRPVTRTPTPTGFDEHQDDDPLQDKTTILILDARGPSDHQLLARAWCAEKGYHAIIGRTGRTCLSCCVREARALGIHIVIRV